MRRTRLCIFVAIFILSISGLMLFPVIFPVVAGPSQQFGNDFPTPTADAVEIEPVEVVSVGGKYEDVVYDGETIEAFTIGETIARSEYPKGAYFTVTITSDLEISRVTLFVRYPHGSGERANAEQTENGWQALLYDRPGQPPWQEFEFYWSITATNGEFIETTRQHFVYSDPTREWYKAETPLLKLYWFGQGASFGQAAMEGMYAIHERQAVGFNGPLAYVPVAVLFPDLESFGEFRGGGAEGSSRLAGFTRNDLGMTVQRFIPTGRTYTCPYYPPASQQTTEWLYAETTETITHEIAHLYQYENNINGPTWFIEGGATWFSLNPTRGRQEGLRDRAVDDDLPTLQGVGPSSSAFTPSGCNALVYWMGASFFQYIYGLYGLEGIAQWHDLIGKNFLMDDALLQITGKTLAELERDWRLYLGLLPDVYVRPTEPYRFPPTQTPFGQ